MGLSDILQKALAAIAVVAFIFDVIAIGTGIRFGQFLNSDGNSPVYIAIPVMMLIVGLVYLVLAILSGGLGLAKNITLPVTGIVALIYFMFTWMQVGLLANIGSTRNTEDIFNIAFIVRQLHRLTLPAKASLAFSILVGLLLMLSLSFFFFMKEEAKIELGNEGHDYADLDH